MPSDECRNAIIVKGSVLCTYSSRYVITGFIVVTGLIWFSDSNIPAVKQIGEIT
jgi:hypothetical protein